MPTPSWKNGRRSSKRTSNAVRFSTAGSASTWPKSGLIVASSVRFSLMPYLMSSPIAARCGCAQPSGRCSVRFDVVTNGSSSSFDDRWMPAESLRASRSATSVPDERRGTSAATHPSGCAAPMSRQTAKPNTCSGWSLKRSWLNGIAELGGPSCRVHARCGFPHAVPRRVFLVVEEHDGVEAHTDRIDGEHRPRCAGPCRRR